MKLLYKRADGIVKTCSARCYNAKEHTRCFCICAGKLHAIGEQQALIKVRDLFLGQTGDEFPQVTRRAQRAIRRMEEKHNAEA